MIGDTKRAFKCDFCDAQGFAEIKLGKAEYPQNWRHFELAERDFYPGGSVGRMLASYDCCDACNGRLYSKINPIRKILGRLGVFHK